MVLLHALEVTIIKELYFDEAMKYENLRDGLRLCCRNVRWKDSVIGYELHAPLNTYKLRQEILSGTYKISPYQTFTIYEPKTRKIVATRIRDRQLQMALCNGGLYEDFVEHFIYDNCACQKGKGTDFAFKRLKVLMRKFYQKHGKNGYVLKMDIHHFFPTTRHDVAKEIVKKKISDPRACQFVCDVIDSFEGEIGIGLGSQISQLVELLVLDGIDHYIKEQLRIKYYIRYMDDFVLIHKDKDYLRYCRDAVEKKLNELYLTLNKKTTIYPLSQGIKFLKWKFLYTETGKILMKMDKKKIGAERRKIKRMLRKEIDGRLAQGTSLLSFQAWRANAKRGDTYYQVKRMERFYVETKEKLENDRRRKNPEIGA